MVVKAATNCFPCSWTLFLSRFWPFRKSMIRPKIGCLKNSKILIQSIGKKWHDVRSTAVPTELGFYIKDFSSFIASAETRTPKSLRLCVSVQKKLRVELKETDCRLQNFPGQNDCSKWWLTDADDEEEEEGLVGYGRITVTSFWVC